jgi:oxygen-independent coproporphyrinogen-3 oxidase
VEVNPEDLDGELLSMLRSSPVTRLSLGVQSLDPGIRRRIGRRGEVAATVKALRHLDRSWPHRSSVDLISGVPGQGPETAREDVSVAVSHGIGHLSIYALSIEPGTALSRRLGPAWSDREDAAARRAWDASIRAAVEAGYERYEVSNFARPGERCLHNLRFWQGKPYVGVGPSAVSTVRLDRLGELPPAAAADASGWGVAARTGASGVPAAGVHADGGPVSGVHAVRWHRNPDGGGDRELLGVRELFLEYIMLQLRTSQGLSVPALSRTFGIDPEALSLEFLRDLEERGLLRLRRIRGEQGERIEGAAATERGFGLLDRVIAEVVEALEGSVNISVSKEHEASSGSVDCSHMRTRSRSVRNSACSRTGTGVTSQSA